MSLERKVERLLDHEAIRQCIYRYCRGIDRADRAALEATYWPDAIDRHLRFEGKRDAFIDYALQFTQGMKTQHMIGNIMIELVSDETANVESYYIAYHELAKGGEREDFVVHGRYLDTFEKRQGEWRIIHRTLTCDLYSQRPSTSDWASGPYANNPALGAFYPDDLVYSIFKN